MNDILFTAIVSIVSCTIALWSWRFLVGVANWLADKWIRRNKWDEGNEFQPMIDYVPFWCLFTGVEHLTKPKRFNRNI